MGGSARRKKDEYKVLFSHCFQRGEWGLTTSFAQKRNTEASQERKVCMRPYLTIDLNSGKKVLEGVSPS